MKTETFKGTVESAWGEKLPKAIEFSGTFDACENYAEIPAKEIPDEKEITEYVNRSRKANARQKAMLEALEAAGYKKPDQSTPEAKREMLIRNLVNTFNVPRDIAEQQIDALIAAGVTTQ